MGRTETSPESAKNPSRARAPLSPENAEKSIPEPSHAKVDMMPRQDEKAQQMAIDSLEGSIPKKDAQYEIEINPNKEIKIRYKGMLVRRYFLSRAQITSNEGKVP
jgi:hypothetical protein